MSKYYLAKKELLCRDLILISENTQWLEMKDKIQSKSEWQI